MKEQSLAENLKIIPYNNNDLYSIFKKLLTFTKPIEAVNEVYKVVTSVGGKGKITQEENKYEVFFSLLEDRFKNFKFYSFKAEKEDKQKIQEKILSTLQQKSSSYMHFIFKVGTSCDEDLQHSLNIFLKKEQLFRIIINPKSDKKIEILENILNEISFVGGVSEIKAMIGDTKKKDHIILYGYKNLEENLQIISKICHDQENEDILPLFYHTYEKGIGYAFNVRNDSFTNIISNKILDCFNESVNRNLDYCFQVNMWDFFGFDTEIYKYRLFAEFLKLFEDRLVKDGFIPRNTTFNNNIFSVLSEKMNIEEPKEITPTTNIVTASYRALSLNETSNIKIFQ